MIRNDLRNIAIIAHVDHGKTTLVDQMLKQAGAFRENQVVEERVMDSGDIERERGITILAKNCSCTYKGVKINIVDTPGHADFGGEVERVLKMVNGVLLLVDAAEGCMPQTRFVLQKALQQNLSLVVAINKIDRPDARIKEVIDEVLYLLMDLGASDEQLECPILFCCGRQGTASLDPDVPGTDLIPLFDTLLDTIQPPQGDPEAPFQMLVSSVDYNEFVGRIGIGRIQNGVAKVGEEVVVCDWHNPDLKMRGRLTKLYDFQANGRQPCDNITAGDIVAFSGLPDVTIGNTLCAPSQVEPLPFVKINDPTVEMTFSVNDSPFAGRAHVHWLTGTASTVMVGTTEGILGLNPETKGLVIDPSIPSEWKEYTMEKTFRGKKLHVTVKNPNGSEHGVKSVTVNGEKIEGKLILDSILKAENDVVIEL